MRISVEGNLGTGKSTLLQELGRGWDVYPEPLAEWHALLEAFYADPQRWSLSMNLQALLSFTRVPSSGIVVTERSPLSCKEVFARLAKNGSSMTEKEWNLFCDIHNVAGWVPDVIIYLSLPVTAALSRVQTRGRTAEQGVTQDYLNKVQFAHNTMLRWYPGELHVVDASQPQEAVVSRVKDVLDAYREK